MTETANTSAGNPASSPAETKKHETPKFRSMEVPAAFHAMADQSVAHTRDIFKNTKTATEEAAQLFQHTYIASAKGARTTILSLRVRPRKYECCL